MSSRLLSAVLATMIAVMAVSTAAAQGGETGSLSVVGMQEGFGTPQAGQAYAELPELSESELVDELDSWPGGESVQQPAGRNASLPGLAPNPYPSSPDPSGVKAEPPAPTTGLSEIERSLGAPPAGLGPDMAGAGVDRALVQFGYDFFQGGRLKEADLGAAASAGYVLRPGDLIRLDIWGSFNASYSLEVDRSGMLHIPKVGPVGVMGMGIAEAEKVIDDSIGKYYTGYEMTMTLGRTRPMQVYVVGEVGLPGTYTIGPFGTVIDALMAAGGPKKTGSLRRISVSRQSGSYTADLYDFLLSGRTPSSFGLSNGDTVMVPVIGPVAGVAGEVRRPGIYELAEGESVAGLIDMAGGLRPGANTSRTVIERTLDHDKRVTVDAGAPDLTKAGILWGNMPASDLDVVKVYPIPGFRQRTVTLSGHVAYPGEYEFVDGMRLSDLIKGYDALLPEPFVDGGTIVRVVPPDNHRERIAFSLAGLLEGAPGADLELMEHDAVSVFSRNQMTEKPTVSIYGEVLSPGVYEYSENMTVRELVSLGKLKRSAYHGEAELTRVEMADGKAAPRNTVIDLARAISGEPSTDVPLRPDDVLIVRPIPDWSEAHDRFVELAGEFRFPGVYSISKGEHLSSVIERAGGFTDKAYMMGAKFTRRSVKVLQQTRMNEFRAQLKKRIQIMNSAMASTASSREELEATRLSLASIEGGLEMTEGLEAEGRVVIRLGSLEDFAGGAYDLVLEPDDRIEVPRDPGVVSVLGEVYNPTSVIYEEGRPLSYYLEKVGGVTEDAAGSEMYIVRADGTVYSRHQSGFWPNWSDDTRRWSWGGYDNTVLYPGDTVLVPQRLDRIAWMRHIKDMTTVLSQIALMAGVLIAAGL